MDSRLAAWAAHLRIEHGHTALTIDAYLLDVRQFIKWLTKRAVAADADSLTSEDIGAYVHALYYGQDPGVRLKRTRKPKTLRRKIVSLRAFFDFLVRCGDLKANPAATQPLPKAAKKAHRIFTEEELARIFNTTDPTKPMGLRNRAALMTIYACALRLGDLLSLDVQDVQEVSGAQVRLHVRRGKGDKQRVTALRGHFARALMQWVAHRLTMDAPDAALFVSLQGPTMGSRLSQDRISEVFNRAAAEVGLKDSETFLHRLRSSGLTHYYDSGRTHCPHCKHPLDGLVDIFDVMRFAGHSSPAQTMEYLAVSDRGRPKGLPLRQSNRIMDLMTNPTTPEEENPDE